MVTASLQTHTPVQAENCLNAKQRALFRFATAPAPAGPPTFPAHEDSGQDEPCTAVKAAVAVAAA